MHMRKCIKMHQCAPKCISVHQNASNICGMNCANFLCINLSKKCFLFHLIRVKCINMHLNASICIWMHQYASECIKMYHNVCRMNYFNVLCMKFQFEKFQFFWLKMTNFFSKCSECINMHQNASKCVQNEMCKCFVHENIKKWVYIAFKGAKISKIHLPLCDGRPCMLLKI